MIVAVIGVVTRPGVQECPGGPDACPYATNSVPRISGRPKGSIFVFTTPKVAVIARLYDRNPSVGYALGTGTSMACPHVAGAAALIKQNNKVLTPKQVKDLIMKGEATDIDRSEQPIPIQLMSRSQRLYVPHSYKPNLK